MSRPAPRIQPRRPVFLGCEGSSEFSYAALLNRLADEIEAVHVHIHAERLQPGAGDPLALVQRATERIAHFEKHRSPFAIKAVLLDLEDEQKNLEAANYARRAGIEHVIWQEPDHEGFLLRHLPGCHQRRPPRGASFAAIRQEWPEYKKGMTAQQLAQRIDLNQIRAASKVENELRAFLTALGMPV